MTTIFFISGTVMDLLYALASYEATMTVVADCNQSRYGGSFCIRMNMKRSLTDSHVSYEIAVVVVLYKTLRSLSEIQPYVHVVRDGQHLNKGYSQKETFYEPLSQHQICKETLRDL